MNKKMSLRMKVLLGDGLMGFIWISLATIKMLQLTNPIKNIALIILLLCSVVSIGSLFVKCDKEDEMSKENMLKAESNTYRGLRGVMLAALLLSFRGAEWDNISLNKFIPIAFGIILLIKSFSFVYYEKYGE
ncbi:MAG TPA: hypothetical protein DG753_05315 [Clostridium sp.]|nr:hypothetical protein [Clostridium sp.]